MGFEHNEDSYSLRERVYNELREGIISGKYKAGDSLPEVKIAQELDVSRTPLREALRKLELEGLVESIPNKGVIVRGISKKDMEDIYRIRINLERLAAVWAVEQIQEDEVKTLEDIYNKMKENTEENNIDAISRLNTEFHNIIYSATKSKIMQNILKDFQVYVKWARHESLSAPGRKEEALQEHHNILEAFKRRDAKAAETYLTIHVKNSSKNVLK